MNKIDYKSLQLKVDDSTKSFSILPGQEIEVLQYLPIEDKNDLVYIAIQKAEGEKEFNLITLDMYYRLYTVYMYSNIEFDEEYRSNEVLLYNELESIGIIDAVINAIPEKERAKLDEYFYETVQMKRKEKESFFGNLKSFLTMLPKNANAAAEIVKKFNPEDFQQVINFARAANGDRPID